MTDLNDTPASADAPTPVAPPERSRAPRALAITGIVLAGVLGLGLVFAAGVGVGRLLPDQRGPIAVEVRGPGVGPVQDRIEQRIDERRDERGERRDERFDERRELFEQWLEEQGIDPSAPVEPTE
jgi:hypothetical protein